MKNEEQLMKRIVYESWWTRSAQWWGKGEGKPSRWRMRNSWWKVFLVKNEEQLIEIIVYESWWTRSAQWWGKGEGKPSSWRMRNSWWKVFLVKNEEQLIEIIVYESWWTRSTHDEEKVRENLLDEGWGIADGKYSLWKMRNSWLK